jgi:hypothetical protein
VKTIQGPKIKKAEFSKAQEAFRNDIERAFGAFQARFAIIREPSSFLGQKSLINIMKACVVSTI